MKNKKIIIAITGASGSIYAQKLLIKLQEFESQFEDIAVIFSNNGKQVWQYELKEQVFKSENKKFRVIKNEDLFDSVASGSAGYDAMIVVPCSMGTLAKIANGIATDLISRAADVILKEQKQLILIARESPYNKIHLQNMLKLIEAGSQIIPASPFFYHHPTSIDELLDPFIARIIEKIGIEIEFERWKSV